MSYLQLNPIAKVELRRRLRSPWSWGVLTLYLFLLALLVGLAYNSIYLETIMSLQLYALPLLSDQAGDELGESVLSIIIGMLFLLSTHLTAALTAITISNEREQHTLDLLLITPLTKQQIVWGKLQANLIFVSLLLVASLPIQGLSLWFGGVTLSELYLLLLGLLITALSSGAYGLYRSCRSSSSTTAIISTQFNLTLFMYGFYHLILLILLLILLYFSSLVANIQLPILGLLLLRYGFGFLSSTNPLSASFLTKIVIDEYNSYMFFWGESFTYLGNKSPQLPYLSPWIIYLLFHLWATQYHLRKAIKQLETFAEE